MSGASCPLAYGDAGQARPAMALNFGSTIHFFFPSVSAQQSCFSSIALSDSNLVPTLKALCVALTQIEVEACKAGRA